MTLQKNIRGKRPPLTIKWSALKVGDVLVDQSGNEHTIEERTDDHIYTECGMDINDQRLLRGWTMR